jgi:hypothetical protein
LSNLGFSSPKTPLPSLVPGKSLTHSVLAFVLVSVVALAEETLPRVLNTATKNRDWRHLRGRSTVGCHLLGWPWL